MPVKKQKQKKSAKITKKKIVKKAKSLKNTAKNAKQMKGSSAKVAKKLIKAKKTSVKKVIAKRIKHATKSKVNKVKSSDFVGKVNNFKKQDSSDSVFFAKKSKKAENILQEKVVKTPLLLAPVKENHTEELILSKIEERVVHLEDEVREEDVAQLDIYPAKIEPTLQYLQELKDVRILPQKHKVNFLSGNSFVSRLRELVNPTYKPELVFSNLDYVHESEEIEDVFAKPQKNNLFQFNYQKNWQLKVVGFFLAAILVVAPLQTFSYYQNLVSTKDRILYMTNEAINNLKLGESAARNLDLFGASNQFGQAKDKFGQARQEVDNLGDLTTEILKILPNENRTVESGVALLEAGQLISESGEILAKSVGNVLDNGNYDNYYQSLQVFRVDLSIIIQKYYQAKEKLKSVDPKSLPAEHREKMATLLKYLPTVENGLTELYGITDSMLYALGDKQWQRYLFIFVNNNELRATGGFQGSFALVDVDRGKIKNMSIPAGGTYDIQGQLVPRVISPEPLHLINPRWEFQDSNWWPDYPTSAKKIAWFYTNANNPSVDGVITISSNMMIELLKIFGPIEMPEYNRTITAENFELETQKIVELEYDKKVNRPKQFLADLAPKLIEKLFTADKEQAKKLFEAAIKGLNERHLLVYFNRPDLQKIVTDFGWSGELRQTQGDFLSVIHTNIAGGKTDEVIDDEIRHIAEVQSDGSIIDTVTIIRKHNGIPNSNPFYGVQNNDYVRIYVPLGSSLLEARGFKRPPEKLFDKPSSDLTYDQDLLEVDTQQEKDPVSGTDIYNESGKTVFGNWLMLPAGSIGEVTIKYKLPFKLDSSSANTYFYSLLVQKQSGTKDVKIMSNLILNDNFKIVAKFPSNLAQENNQVNFSSDLNVDQFYGVALVNK